MYKFSGCLRLQQWRRIFEITFLRKHRFVFCPQIFLFVFLHPQQFNVLSDFSHVILDHLFHLQDSHPGQIISGNQTTKTLEVKVALRYIIHRVTPIARGQSVRGLCSTMRYETFPIISLNNRIYLHRTFEESARNWNSHIFDIWIFHSLLSTCMSNVIRTINHLITFLSFQQKKPTIRNVIF